MKLCNQTSDPNECRIFFQRQGWETYSYAPVAKTKSFSWKYGYRATQKRQNKYFFWFWGVHTDPPNPGSAWKSEFFSTLGLYCTVNKTIRNVLLVTIKEPLTRPFQNTPYFSQSDNLSIVGECPKFGNFQILIKR